MHVVSVASGLVVSVTVPQGMGSNADAQETPHLGVLFTEV